MVKSDLNQVHEKYSMSKYLTSYRFARQTCIPTRVQWTSSRLEFDRHRSICAWVICKKWFGRNNKMNIIPEHGPRSAQPLHLHCWRADSKVVEEDCLQLQLIKLLHELGDLGECRIRAAIHMFLIDRKDNELDYAPLERVLITEAEAGEFLKVLIILWKLDRETCDFTSIESSVDKGYLKYLMMRFVEMKMNRPTLHLIVISSNLRWVYMITKTIA